MRTEWEAFSILSLLLSPPVVSGDPSEEEQDGLLITHVGSDGTEGYPIQTVGHDDVGMDAR